MLRYYRERLFPLVPPQGPRVLEIGVVDPSEALLSIVADRPGEWDLVGIDLTIPDPLPAGLRYRWLAMNANDLSAFADASFDTVLCHGVFGNDRYFWRSVAEIRRVLRPGGLLYTSVTTFPRGANKLRMKRLLYKLGDRLHPYGLRDTLVHIAENTWFSSVPTYHFSPTPADYYRFSDVAVREVIFDGYEVLHLEEVLHPPRAIAAGRKL